MDTILRADVAICGENIYIQRLLNWYDRKIPIFSQYHDSYCVDAEDSNVDVFIKKYYEILEITEVTGNCLPLK